jgi:hypothetical protein
MTLSNDTSRCTGNTLGKVCPKRDECARYTEWVAPHHGPSDRMVPVTHWVCRDDTFASRVPVGDTL